MICFYVKLSTGETELNNNSVQNLQDRHFESDTGTFSQLMLLF